jgi:hypothetical protein
LCEPLSGVTKTKQLQAGPNGWVLILVDTQNDSETNFLDVEGGGAGVTEDDSNICAPDAAACTLIGDEAQVIVFTPKTLVNGGSQLGSRATFAEFSSAGKIKDGMYLDTLVSGSLLSFYMVHELFHTLDSPKNMGAAGI